jgi:hypothetical protein
MVIEVDTSSKRHPVEGDAHVVEAVDRDADLADLTRPRHLETRCNAGGWKRDISGVRWRTLGWADAALRGLAPAVVELRAVNARKRATDVVGARPRPSRAGTAL